MRDERKTDIEGRRENERERDGIRGRMGRRKSILHYRQRFRVC